MRKETLNKVGLAAVIMLAPGGFILGASLAALYYRKRMEAAERAKANAVEASKDQPAGL